MHGVGKKEDSKQKTAIKIAAALLLIVCLSLTAYGIYARAVTPAQKTAYKTEDLPLELEPDPHPITVAPLIKGGTVTVNRTEALFGERVLVSVTSDSGKALAPGGLTVTQNGKTSVIANGAFIMNASDAEISAQFVNTIDGISIDPLSFLHGRVYIWKDDNNRVRISALGDSGYKVDAVTVTDEPVTGSGERYSFIKRDDIDARILVTWQKAEYAVTYALAGGTIDSPRGESILTSYTISDTPYALPLATKTGYSFLGWLETNESANADAQSNKENTKRPSATHAVSSIVPNTARDLDYTALWESVPYSILYRDGEEAMDCEPRFYTIDTPVTLPVPQKRGYTFLGWYGDKACTHKAAQSIKSGTTGEQTFYAKWEPTQYALSFDTVGGTFESEHIPQSYTIGKTSMALPVPVKKGYEFLGWNNSALGAQNAYTQNRLFFSLEANTIGDAHFTAHWKPRLYTASFINEDGTKLFENISYNIEESVMLPAPVKAHYDFTGWSEKNTAGGALPIRAITKGNTGNKELVARFTPKRYPINLHLSGTGTQTLYYTVEDADFTVKAAARDGWTFAGWYEDSALTKKTSAFIPRGSSGKRDFYADWRCTVHFESNGGTKITDVSLNAKNAALQTLPEPEREYYTFGGWYKESTYQTKARAGEAVHGSTTLYAKWVPVTFEISYNPNGGKMPSRYTNEYTVETKATSLPVPRRENWAFGGWYADSSFKTPVTQAFNSENKTSPLLYERRIKTGAQDVIDANKSVLQNKSGYTNVLQNGLYTMDTLYSKTAVESAKVETNSDMTLFAKWFKFDVRIVPKGKYLYAAESGKIEVMPNDLEVSATEITRSTFKTVMGYDPSDNASATYKDEDERDANPVQTVSWYEAIAFCNRFSMMNGFTPAYSIKGSTDPDDWGAVPDGNDLDWMNVTWNTSANGYRLPTESEWMWCAMGGPCNVQDLDANGVNVNGRNKKFAGHELSEGKASGKKLKQYAWYSSNSLAKSHPVGTTIANEAGIWDMSGNVWEWCWDKYILTEDEIKQRAKEGESVKDFDSNAYRPVHGGSWYSYSSLVTVNARLSLNVYGRNAITGFRVVRTLFE